MDREAALVLAGRWDAWACKIAVRWYRLLLGKGPRIELDDLCSAARLGMWKAALRYDGLVPFPGYAKWAVRHEIQQYVRPELARGFGMTTRERAKIRTMPIARFSELGDEFDVAEDFRPLPLGRTVPSHAERGRKGGPARAAKLSPERRREIAKAAATARWKH